MITQMFAVLDAKAAVFGTPFFMANNAMAIRSFTAYVNEANPQNMIFNHPEDFSLYHIGSFDDSIAEVKSIVPAALVTASSVKKPIPKFLDGSPVLREAQVAESR